MSSNKHVLFGCIVSISSLLGTPTVSLSFWQVQRCIRWSRTEIFSTLLSEKLIPLNMLGGTMAHRSKVHTQARNKQAEMSLPTPRLNAKKKSCLSFTTVLRSLVLGASGLVPPLLKVLALIAAFLRLASPNLRPPMRLAGWCLSCHWPHSRRELSPVAAPDVAPRLAACSQWRLLP